MKQPPRRSREFANAASSCEHLAFCRRLPKVELSAHLNGCVRDSTLRELAAGLQLDGKPVCLDGLVQLAEETSPSFGECFQMFELLHTITTNHAAITRITREALIDFAEDGAVYVELRTTPKCRPDLGVTRESYMAAVLEGVRQYYENSYRPREADLDCRLLLSIDREKDTDDAMATVELAAQLRDQGVVGVALTGNPTVGEWAELRPALDAARGKGLKVSLEAEGFNPSELAEMLAWRPDRLGHCCCLTPDTRQQLLQSRIPVEICLTSNVVTRVVMCYADHPFGELFREGHPVAICTDDSGILNTSLTQELAIAAQTFGVSHRELRAMVVSSADYTFLPEKEKRVLRKRLQASLGAVVEVAEEGEEEDGFAEDTFADDSFAHDSFAPMPSLSKTIGSEGSEPPEPPPEPQATPDRRSFGWGRRSWGSRRSSSHDGQGSSGRRSGSGGAPQLVPAAAQSSRPRFSWRSLWAKSE